jgi:hypothetical protein
VLLVLGTNSSLDVTIELSRDRGKARPITLSCGSWNSAIGIDPERDIEVPVGYRTRLFDATSDKFVEQYDV